MTLLRWIFIVFCAGSALQAHCTEVLVAVAANFTAPMKAIAQQFERDTGHKAILSYGATGQIYAQIQHGAPFHVFLSADSTTPSKIAQNGLGLANSQFTYAEGGLVLWSKNPKLVDAQGAILKAGQFEKIAIANPKLAPYGAAAVEVLETLGLRKSLASKMVQGTNISQTYQFIASGGANLGFLAFSQVYRNGKLHEGSAWLVPAHLHRPIRQDAILLNKGKDHAAAHAFMRYLRSSKAQALIRSFGYHLPTKY
jgi:molybdate transport system substrate-binding protein